MIADKPAAATTTGYKKDLTLSREPDAWNRQSLHRRLTGTILSGNSANFH